MAPSEGLVRLTGVGFAYRPGAPVLDGVDLQLGAGLTLVVGPNGAGKSTLLRLIAGVERPTAGAIEIGGQDLWQKEVAARRQLVYIPEQPDLSPYATLEETLGLVARLRGFPAHVAIEALERVGLAGHEERSIRQLSMGQRRRTLLAAAWIGRPRVAILDEPLEAMDRGGRDQIVDWVESLRSEGAAVLLATHEIEPFLASVDRVLAVRAGVTELADVSTFTPEERLVQIDARAR